MAIQGWSRWETKISTLTAIFFLLLKNLKQKKNEKQKIRCQYSFILERENTNVLCYFLLLSFGGLGYRKCTCSAPIDSAKQLPTAAGSTPTPAASESSSTSSPTLASVCCLALLFKFLNKKHFWDFPGGPVVNTLHFQHRVHGFDPWLGK